ncbi:helix-turn-helix transcriptional regulator [Thermobifida halotolerans]|uniref:HTH-type transcriptional regulator RipA n=1 Tax=Thermobifida halotolerans TaxID=483545 RepID=A0AA97M539_9ACTN|nr:helix-turn-helix transcriptional regulator [Thermobifida halotolerans]UOE20768.1 helix-turn-helix transcriptional regulator [Thermobifida halotolerans]
MGTRRRADSAARERRPPVVVRPAVPFAPDVEIPFVIATETDVPDCQVEWEPHTHPVHELVWVRRGVMRVRIGRRLWALPNLVGLWIPAGTVHSGRLSAGAEFHASYFSPSTCTFLPEGPVSVRIVPLLHELLVFLEGTRISDAARRHAEGLVFELLEPSPHGFDLPLPLDPRIEPIVSHLVDHPDDRRSLGEWAALTGVSSRTLARAFLASTGHSFGQWRQALRVHVSLALLSSGLSVAETAEAVGYDRPSSFIEVFRRVTGVTPGQYHTA